MDIHDLEKLIKERRSIRRWTKKEVPDDLIKKAIELGTWAPNGGNYQGWRFIAVKNREVKNKLADAVQRITDKVAPTRLYQYLSSKTKRLLLLVQKRRDLCYW